MTNYEDGRRFEWQVRDDLQTDGYEIIRSAGSKGKIDVLAFKPYQILAIQCKRSGRAAPAERAELIRLARLLTAVPIIARHQRGRSKPIYERLFGTGPQDHVPFITDELEI